MKLTITHQDSYSRGELLLRTIFGGIYIVIPHMFIMIFVNIWTGIVNFISWWAILFTGKYPKSMFEFMVRYLNWYMRLNATLMNMVDGYPAIGPGGTSEKVKLEVEYPASLSRGKLLLKTIFGMIFIVIPHGVCLGARMYAGQFLSFLAWWAILFTGKHPADFHAFNVGSLRWMVKLTLYTANMSDEYPPLIAKE